MAAMKDLYNRMCAEIKKDNDIVFALFDNHYPDSIYYTRKASNMDYTFKRLMDSIYNDVDDTVEETSDFLDREERYTVFINSLYLKEIEKAIEEIISIYEDIDWKPYFDEEFYKPYFVARLIKSDFNSYDEDFFII